MPTLPPASQGYPIILGGDHAAYELEHAGMDPRLRSDWPLPSFDAKDWAEAFCKIARGLGFKDAEGKPIDEGWMIAWFANSLMRGYDEQTARLEPVIAELLAALKPLSDGARRQANSLRHQVHDSDSPIIRSSLTKAAERWEELHAAATAAIAKAEDR